MTEKYTPSDSALPANFRADDFGADFKWGTALSAFQTEGASTAGGRSPSIWDTFAARKHKIKNNDSPETATEFYSRYRDDIDLVSDMNFRNFRFSASWSRVLPNGTGKVNERGIDYYARVIEACLEKNIDPWITLYHWDLPQILEDKGGWANRDMVAWFEEYAYQVVHAFGDRVKNWIVLNEPVAFTALGYLTGKHAPGKRSMRKFLPAVHHAALAQAAGGKVIRTTQPIAYIGTTFSVSTLLPAQNTERDCVAASKLEAGLNKLFIEPALGMGYPFGEIPELKRIERYMRAGDEAQLAFDFDFMGLQYYFRVMAAYSRFSPLNIREIPATRRDVPISSMGYEIYPQGIYTILKKFGDYPGIKEIILTEAGVCLDDMLQPNGRVADTGRINYYVKMLESVLLAKRMGVPVRGFFTWSPTDNFEWAEGYSARFGLTYVDYKTQRRYMKDSGFWFRDFLRNQAQ